jgi:hypothetical protein
MPNFTIINRVDQINLSHEWTVSTQFKSQNRIVDIQGQPVTSNYQGYKYKIIEKRERLFSTQERIGRIALASFIVICTLCFGLYVKDIRNLFIKSKQSIRFAVVFNPPPVQLTQQPSVYEKLKKIIGDRRELTGTDLIYITDENGKNEKPLLEILGKGGSKIAIRISDSHALILPNMDVDFPQTIAGRWERMVDEEVLMSNVLIRVGLLSPSSKKVSVTLTDTSRQVVPAYVCDTFESLSKKGWFIIDTKNYRSSTWIRETHHLFQSDRERLIIENWDLVFNSMLSDIRTLCDYQICVEQDSLNIAVVKKAHPSSASCYELRYFGFDFSDKNGSLRRPNSEKKPLTSQYLKQGIKLIDRVLVEIFDYEFGIRAYSFQNLKCQLHTRYSAQLTT